MRLLIAIFVILNIAYASQNTFILNHSGLVDQRAYIKITTIFNLWFIILVIYLINFIY